ncbi:hypothetical protein JTE90_017199 [Oedothorax gibbosus]|uniref:Uncharacterized protein n=1 Tax=Oedothorax gibbosus TaxID=931172 RepID=A0AAV6V832_9ARAC|nr:hypothetical protein JTE90_017199 [Oedothorax gibbosus]
MPSFAVPKAHHNRVHFAVESLKGRCQTVLIGEQFLRSCSLPALGSRDVAIKGAFAPLLLCAARSPSSLSGIDKQHNHCPPRT